MSVVAIAAAFVVWDWLPYNPHARAMRIIGRTEPAADERVLNWWRARKRNRRGQPLTTRLLQSLIVELQAGLVPEQVFSHVLGAPYAAPRALLELAPTADVHIWRDVAHVWMSSDAVGFSMATALQRVHAYALVDQEVWREVQSNAAAPRFAMLTLIAMPMAAWLVGGLSGASPVHFLFSNPIGWACLAFGLTCYGLAFLWMRAMTRRALR